MTRVRKNIETGNVEQLKDNLSRWIFSLKECQFYFDKLPIPDEIDLGAELKDFEGQTINFDFKYVSQKLERFVPDNAGWGKYVSYETGALWKIGNAGARSSRSSGASSESSTPPFFVDNVDIPLQNGLKVPYVIAVNGDKTIIPRSLADVDPLNALKSQSGVNSSKIAEGLDIAKQQEQNSNFNAGQAINTFLSNSKVQNSISKNLESLGANQLFVAQVQSTVLSSQFFDAQGKLDWNSPFTPASTGNINTAVMKLYDIASPTDPRTVDANGNVVIEDSSQYTAQQLAGMVGKVGRTGIMANRLDSDAAEGRTNYVRDYRNVPYRLTRNTMAQVNPQKNIQYINAIGNQYNLKGYKPPIKSSFSTEKGNQLDGNLYILDSLVNFVGVPLAKEIVGGIGKPQFERPTLGMNN